MGEGFLEVSGGDGVGVVGEGREGDGEVAGHNVEKLQGGGTGEADGPRTPVSSTPVLPPPLLRKLAPDNFG